ncbi:hypothetical protein PR048_009611 [Dryococelus australis]|uniref:Uncharacterized protein n=1 Tax=Dryococelus australis TaxID=614101 RepID=A0ABQ9I0H1_9NEOP|nr:hypothetical protein PR048_009611 [Dryococelus australis]
MRKQGILKVIIPNYEVELLHKIDEINRTTVYGEEYKPRTDDIPQCANCQSQMHPMQTRKTRHEHYHTKSCLKLATIPAHCHTQVPSHNTTHQTTPVHPPLLTQQQTPNKNTTTPDQQSTQEHNTNKQEHIQPDKQSVTINYIKKLLDFLRDPLIMDMLTHFRPYMKQTRLEMDKGRRRHIVLETISTYLAQDYD